MRIKGAAGKIPFANLDGRHFPAALVHLQDEFFRVGLLVDIHFREADAAFRWARSDDNEVIET